MNDLKDKHNNQFMIFWMALIRWILKNILGIFIVIFILIFIAFWMKKVSS